MDGQVNCGSNNEYYWCTSFTWQMAQTSSGSIGRCSRTALPLAPASSRVSDASSFLRWLFWCSRWRLWKSWRPRKSSLTSRSTKPNCQEMGLSGETRNFRKRTQQMWLKRRKWFKQFEKDQSGEVELWNGHRRAQSLDYSIQFLDASTHL